MEKMMMLCCIAMAATISLWAETEKVNGYTWTYRINGDEAEIYGDINLGCDRMRPSISPRPKGFVKIPSLLGGKPVTIIGEAAFGDCEEITGVSIPKSVTSIEKYAFFNCIKLQNVKLPSGLTSIGDDAFARCFELKHITIPNGVTIIGNCAFLNCSLLGLKIPSSVIGIGDQAFAGNNTLRGAMMPKRFKTEKSRIFVDRYGSCRDLNISYPDEQEVIIRHTDSQERGMRYGW